MDIVTVLTFLFGSIGVLMIGVGIFTYFHGNKAKNWPKTQGRIILSQVLRSTGWKASYSGWVVYEYTVMGRVYRSQSITVSEMIGINFTSKSEAVGRIALYPPNQTVPVFYDPANPSRSVLETTGDTTLLILGLIFLTFALAIHFVQ